jgi:hypothetical protein
MSYSNSNSNSNSNGNGYRESSSSHRNSGKYIPRERDDRRGDDRRGDDRRGDDRRGDDRRGGVRDTITSPSICIPRTFTTIRGEQTKRTVFNTFRDLRIGHIERIDTVHKTDQKGDRYCTVYIHLSWNMSNTLARETRQKLLEGQDIKVVYDEPWFWKCTMSNMEKPDDRNPQRTHTSSRPRIDLGDGVRALSRDPRSEHAQEPEHHDERQLCNMDPENGDD